VRCLEHDQGQILSKQCLPLRVRDAGVEDRQRLAATPQRDQHGRPNRTRLVPLTVLTGHVSSLTPCRSHPTPPRALTHTTPGLATRESALGRSMVAQRDKVRALVGEEERRALAALCGPREREIHPAEAARRVALGEPRAPTVSTGRGTRRVRSLRGEGRDVSSWYEGWGVGWDGGGEARAPHAWAAARRRHGAWPVRASRAPTHLLPGREDGDRAPEHVREHEEMHLRPPLPSARLLCIVRTSGGYAGPPAAAACCARARALVADLREVSAVEPCALQNLQPHPPLSFVRSLALFAPSGF